MAKKTNELYGITDLGEEMDEPSRFYFQLGEYCNNALKEVEGALQLIEMCDLYGIEDTDKSIQLLSKNLNEIEDRLQNLWEKEK